MYRKQSTLLELRVILEKEKEIGIRRLTGVLNDRTNKPRRWWTPREVASLLYRRGKDFAKKLPKRYIDRVMNSETYYRYKACPCGCESFLDTAPVRRCVICKELVQYCECNDGN